MMCLIFWLSRDGIYMLKEKYKLDIVFFGLTGDFIGF